jgi:hypothetical protein
VLNCPYKPCLPVCFHPGMSCALCWVLLYRSLLVFFLPFPCFLQPVTGFRTGLHQRRSLEHNLDTTYGHTQNKSTLGKRLTSVHSREQRYSHGQGPGLPEWIYRCLSQVEPLVLKSMNNKSLLTQTTLFPVHNTQPIIVTGLIDSGYSARAFADQNIVPV